MEFVIVVFFFSVGLVVGSFLNVVIIRGERGESLGGRSRCRSCGRTLSARELVPIASYILQRGACRGCGRRISLQYPAVEIGTALAFAAIAAFLLRQGYFDISIFRYAEISAAFAAAAAAIVILVSDLRFQIIPDGAAATLGLAGLIFSFSRGTIMPDLGVALACALFFFLLWFVSRGRWMGFGDVKLAAAASLIVGYPAAVASVLFAFWFGGVVGAALLIFGKKTWGSRIPFGPFILAGSVAGWLWTDMFLAFTGLGILL